MNSLKTLFVSAVLVAVLYGAYLAMNRNTEPAPPMDEATAWDGAEKDSGLNIKPGTQMRAPTVLQGQAGATTASSKAKSVASPAPQMSMSFNVPKGGPGGPSPTKPAASPVIPKRAAVKSVAVNSTRVLSRPPQVTIPPVTKLKNPAYLSKAAAQPASQPRPSYTALMGSVRGELSRNRMLDAYRMLSSRYRDPMFTPAENGQIERLLDQLAGTIVYSTQHFIDRPHQVGPNETLEQIAHRYKVPPQLLAKINGLPLSRPLKPGSQIKVVRGPFSAEINLSKHELTLRLPDGGYAGRFPIGVGRDVPQVEKAYRVYDKIETPPGPAVTPGVASSGPLAKQKWIGLEGRLGIHATSNPADVGRSGAEGGITLRARDVDDLYDILSVGSKIVIRR